MISFPGDINFSSTHANKRRDKARTVLGADVVDRILAYGLFLLGAKREQIAQYLNMPLGTFLSLLTRVNIHGLEAMQDRRRTMTHAPATPQKKKKEPRCSVHVQQDYLQIAINVPGCKLILPADNPLQCKAVLLTFLGNGLLTTKEVARAVSLSPRRINALNTAMREQDLHALLDQRKGQKKDYRFTPEIKSELIQQFALNALSGQPTSGRAIAEDLQRRCEMELSGRAVRLHLNKLGLSKIADSLPELFEAQKKTSSTS